MRFAAVSAAIVAAIAATGAALRTPEPTTIVRERRVEVPVEVPVTVEKTRVEERVVETTRVERVEVPVPASPASHHRFAFLLERELKLSAEQGRHVERVLREREGEIESYHKEIRSTGVFRPKEYGRRIREIQHASYERIATVLDTEQHRRFRGLLNEGRVGDAVAFTLDPGMVVVE